jgi:hypothetical protein
MAKEYIYVSGKVKWLRNDSPNEWGKWTHVIYLDAKSLEIIRDLQTQGIKNQMKKDEDGYYMTFSRPVTLTVKGKLVPLEPPLIVLEDGFTPIQDMRVGNGSDVTTKLEVYSHKVPNSDKKAKAIRWESTRVDNLVPFEPKEHFSDAEKVQVAGLAEQPRPLF